ncbi:GNAT family N-acetyltransferase [Haliangium ochraceum]|uniref:N-acetyltransferase domain-containing protein n=1 Tax=Haliangium ochraceum (strain DSM 14365 / JCM 11303 / SMP-2) TaxID=502025 RepID=D0LLF3_HALO1|nr:GNAT family protein [Haliangium ochraceum]ACY18649.1 conserved hypothetical protein [Haliangium ochraceum DSM 14365]
MGNTNTASPTQAADWSWTDALDESQKTEIALLLNRVLEVDDTVGFPGPIPHERALTVATELDEAIRTGRSHLLVAKQGERFVGQCVLIPSASPNNRHVGWVVRSMIDPSMRLNGLVRRALPPLVERCDALGIEVLCIDVRVGTPAETIWRHVGFQPIGILPDYSRVNGKSSDGLYMYQRVADLKQQCPPPAA